jgi:hypothetical protein
MANIETEPVDPATLSPEEQFALLGGWAGRSDAFGQYYKRREPQGDAGDVVRLTGATRVSTTPEVQTDILVVEAAEFGVVPADWDSAVEVFEVADFIKTYRKLDDAERSLLVLEQKVAAEKAADAIDEKYPDGSPWSYVAPVKRRSGKKSA